ncbi:RelA/SpoT domain-containing protein [Mycobacterium terramassiliense]|nr:RelA/SpoT domain-containing protein [Mycobacterium terramassiliense]
MAASVPSVSAVNRAGNVLRNLRVTGNRVKVPAAVEITAEQIFAALDTLEAWRAAHARPLGAATMGLRSRVATMGCAHIEVSQRLKRIPTIIDKLRREPGMNLGRMHDIGGCRAVLQSLDEVQRVQSRYSGDPVTARTKDYVAQPKPDGYRAVHVIVRYQGRLIEVQLRTQVQHEWAYTVESVTSRFGLDIKAGGGPPPVRDWFAAVSEAMALEEHDQPVGPELLHRVYKLRETAQPYLQGVRR